jgi:uncharacterized protein YkwD
MRALVFVLCFGMLACSSPASPDSPRDFELPPPTVAALDTATAVVELTNVERGRGGLAPLSASDRLIQAAQLHAEQMAKLGRLNHVLMDAIYPRPEDRLAAVAYRWQAFAENVAFGQRTPTEVVEGWMRSPGHRANIMNAVYTELGIGYARDENNKPYWVQVFGKPITQR